MAGGSNRGMDAAGPWRPRVKLRAGAGATNRGCDGFDGGGRGGRGVGGRGSSGSGCGCGSGALSCSLK